MQKLAMLSTRGPESFQSVSGTISLPMGRRHKQSKFFSGWEHKIIKS